MNPQGHALRANLWQFIGVVMAFILGVLVLLAAIVALPDPGRAICAAICIVVMKKYKLAYVLKHWGF